MKTQLKNWSFGALEDYYTAPELLVPRLQGNVYNHTNKRHYDEKFIVTSKLMGKRNGLVVTHSGSEYELLEVDPEYEKQFPNAKKRLFNQLKEV
jgi:hypothetical protein